MELKRPKDLLVEYMSKKNYVKYYKELKRPKDLLVEYE